MKEKSLMLGLNYNDEIIPICNKPNKSTFSIGKSGSGKTYSFYVLAPQVLNDGESVLVLDVENSFSISEFPEPIIEFLGDKVQIFDVGKGDEIPVNPFNIKSYINNDTKKYITNTAQRIADIFEENLKLSIAQKKIIYQAYIDCAEIQGNVDLEGFYDAISLRLDEKGLKVSANIVYSKLSPIVENVPFYSGTDEIWNDLLYNDAKFTVIQLSSLPDLSKKITVDILLSDLMEFISANASINKDFVCIINEIQGINNSENSPIGKLLTTGRKFGAAVWVSTQFLGKNSIAVKRYEQAATKLIFSPTESDIDNIINKFLSKKDKSWKELMHILKPGMCIVSSVDNALDDNLKKIVKVFSIEQIIENLSKK